MNLQFVIAVVLWTSSWGAVSSMDVRLSFMFPHNSKLKHLIGPTMEYATSAGALAIAIDRIEKEGILPGVNLTADWRYDQCDEAVAAGLAIEMLRDQADVVFGPPCSIPAAIVGVLGNFYNIAQFSWAATSIDLADTVRYPTMVRVIGSAYRNHDVVVWSYVCWTIYSVTEGEGLAAISCNTEFRLLRKTDAALGRAMVEILSHFGWTRVALFYTDDKGTQKCVSVAQGAYKFFPLNDIHIVLYQEIDKEAPTDAEIEKFLDHFPKLTRVALLCIDADHELRRFMLRAQEKGASGDEYVYIVPDYVRFENKTDVWTDRSTGSADRLGTSENRDVESRESMQNLLFIEMLLSSNDELFAFKKEVIQRIKKWPFFFDDADLEQQDGSLFSPFLHDAVYLYALALNKTLAEGGKLRDGRLIASNTKNMHFQGVSGHVIIDDVMGREPTFVLKGFTKSGNLTQLLKAEMYKTSNINVPDSSRKEILFSRITSRFLTNGRRRMFGIDVWTGWFFCLARNLLVMKLNSISFLDDCKIAQLVPEYVMWEMRNGYVPKWYPRCGWFGELCADKDGMSVTTIIVGAVISGVVILIAIAGFFYYYRNKVLSDEMAQMLWKIDSRQLLKLVEMQNSGSLATVSTDVSEDIAEIVLRGDERVAYFRNQLVWMKAHNSSMVMSSKQDHFQIKLLRDILHDNLNVFVGLCLDSQMPISVWRYGSKGSLQDVLLNPQMKLDFFFKYSLIRDLTNGLEHLHKSEIKTHGHLTSSNCLVNNRWVLMITDYGLPMLRNKHMEDKDLLWSAPEFLRMNDPPRSGTPAGDIYSFAIVLSEILSRDLAFASHNKLPAGCHADVINLVRAGLDPGFRPDLTAMKKDADMDPNMVTLVRDCWIEDPNLRPDIKHVKTAVKQMSKGREGTLLDHVMKMMERYAANMETTINDRTRELADESKKTDVLLYKFLPKKIADKLKSGQSVEPEAIDQCSIVFSNIAQFDQIIEKSSPLQVVLTLNDIYFQLDEIVDDYECFKVQSVNDTYMLACGLDVATQDSIEQTKKTINESSKNNQGRHHCCVAADLALHFQLRMASHFMSHLPNEKCQLKLGIHTGPAVAGVIGQSTPRYLLFGETVEITRSLLESAKAATIHISEKTNTYLTDTIGGYITKPRGEMNTKSGTVFTFWLLGKKVKGIEDKTATSGTSSGGESTGPEKKEKKKK